jgi:hypothetical protein
LSYLFLNFYNTTAHIESYDQEILSLLQKDFSGFVAPHLPSPNFHLSIFKETPPFHEIPSMVASMQTFNSVCYDHQGKRYCDYYGEALVILDTKTNRARIYSQSSSRLHEICYLLILSRVGKAMDLSGLHKLHAFSVSYKDVAIICMMPMKGGKSTLLMEFLKDDRFKIISDDIPVIDLKGEVRPFPMKIGLSKRPESLKIFQPEKNLYEMNRSQYGKKELLCLEGLPGRVEDIEKRFKKVILIEAFRYNSHTSILKKMSFVSTGKGLFKHGVIGFGLPMVIEYFWEFGFADFCRKVMIFFSRSLAFGCLLFRAKKMKLLLGKNPQEASEVIINYVVRNYEKI